MLHLRQNCDILASVRASLYRTARLTKNSLAMVLLLLHIQSFDWWGRTRERHELCRLLSQILGHTQLSTQDKSALT